MADSMSVAPVSQLDDILKDFLDICNSLQITVEGKTVQPLKVGTVLDDDQNPTRCGFVLSDEFLDVLGTITYALHLSGGYMKVLDEGTVMFAARNADLIESLRRLKRDRQGADAKSRAMPYSEELVLPVLIRFSRTPPSISIDLEHPSNHEMLAAAAFLDQNKKPAALRWLYDVLHKELKVRHLDASGQRSH